MSVPLRPSDFCFFIVAAAAAEEEEEDDVAAVLVCSLISIAIVESDLKRQISIGANLDVALKATGVEKRNCADENLA